MWRRGSHGLCGKVLPKDMGSGRHENLGPLMQLISYTEPISKDWGQRSRLGEEAGSRQYRALGGMLTWSHIILRPRRKPWQVNWTSWYQWKWRPMGRVEICVCWTDRRMWRCFRCGDSRIMAGSLSLWWMMVPFPERARRMGRTGPSGAGIMSTIWRTDLAVSTWGKQKLLTFHPKRNLLLENSCIIMRCFCFLWALSSIFFFFLIER